MVRVDSCGRSCAHAVQKLSRAEEKANDGKEARANGKEESDENGAAENKKESDDVEVLYGMPCRWQHLHCAFHREIESVERS